MHTTGEMTNPLPIEDALISALAAHGAVRLCVVGQRRALPVLFVETKPRETAPPPKLPEAALGAALALANAASPAYSRILRGRVSVVAAGSLPVSGKGVPQRHAVEARYARLMDAMDAELMRSGAPSTAKKSGGSGGGGGGGREGGGDGGGGGGGGGAEGGDGDGDGDEAYDSLASMKVSSTTLAGARRSMAR